MESPLKNKSYSFAIRIVKLSKYLQAERNEFILSKQALRSGTQCRYQPVKLQKH